MKHLYVHVKDPCVHNMYLYVEDMCVHEKDLYINELYLSWQEPLLRQVPVWPPRICMKHLYVHVK